MNDTRVEPETMALPVVSQEALREALTGAFLNFLQDLNLEDVTDEDLAVTLAEETLVTLQALTGEEEDTE